MERDYVTLMDYARVLVKRRRPIAAACAAAFLVSAAVSLLLPEYYRATAKVIPPRAGGQAGLAALMKGDIMGQLMSGPDLVGQQYISILKSRTVADKVIDRFNLMERYKAKRRSAAVAALGRKMAAKLDRKDGIITVSVEDKDPKTAAAMTNALVEEMGAAAARMKAGSAASDRRFLEERLAGARAELAASGEALKEFQKKNKVISPELQAGASVEEAAQLKAMLAAKEVQLASLRSYQTDAAPDVVRAKAAVREIRSRMAEAEGKGSGVVPSAGAIPDMAEQYARLMREYKVKEAVVTELSRQYEAERVQEAREAVDMQVLDWAAVPDRPAGPRRKAIMLMSTFTAFFLSVLAALLAELNGRLPEDERLSWRGLTGGK